LLPGIVRTELPLDLARIRAAAELTLAIECEEGVVDEIRRGPGFTLENMPICTKMPGERSQTGIGGGEKALERHLVLRVGRTEKVGGEEFVDLAMKIGSDSGEGHVALILLVSLPAFVRRAILPCVHPALHPTRYMSTRIVLISLT
jgi:hypothetical protein